MEREQAIFLINFFSDSLFRVLFYDESARFCICQCGVEWWRVCTLMLFVLLMIKVTCTDAHRNAIKAAVAVRQTAEQLFAQNAQSTGLWFESGRNLKYGFLVYFLFCFVFSGRQTNKHRQRCYRLASCAHCTSHGQSRDKHISIIWTSSGARYGLVFSLRSKCGLVSNYNLGEL